MSTAAGLVRIGRVLGQTRGFAGHRYVLPRALAGYLRMLAGGPPRLKAAELSVGAACDLACAHCYATGVTARRAPLGDLVGAVDALGKAGCLSVMLVGGEPALRPDLEEIVAAIRARRMLAIVFSNGQRLDRARIRSLRDAGLFGLVLSLLGTRERHDAFVGRAGAFDAVLAAAEAAREAGLFVSFNITATRASLTSGDFLAVAALARERRIPLKLNYPALLGRFSGRFDELLDAEQRRFLAAERAAGRVSTDLDTGWWAASCPAGTHALYVTDGGEVTPCAYIPISFGNLREEPLETICARMACSPLLAARGRTCLVGEDRRFVETVIGPTFAREDLPVRWDRHPLGGAAG